MVFCIIHRCQLQGENETSKTKLSIYVHSEVKKLFCFGFCTLNTRLPPFSIPFELNCENVTEERLKIPVRKKKRNYFSNFARFSTL